MAGFKGVGASNDTLDFNLGNGTPGTVYIALFTTAPSDSGGGVEVTGGSYARVAVTNNATTWPAAASKTKSNGIAFDFGTATGNWGTIAFAAVVKTASGALGSSDIIYAAAPSGSPRIVNSGDSFKIPIGGFIATEA